MLSMHKIQRKNITNIHVVSIKKHHPPQKNEPAKTEPLELYNIYIYISG